MHDDVIDKVRRALGHVGGTVAPPMPPGIDEKIARLVASDANLVEVFAKNAKEQKMLLTRTSAGQMTTTLVEFLEQHPIKRVALAASERLARLGIENALREAGFDVRRWDQISLDEMYDFDCAVTDVACAVAENATLVIKPSAEQGRSMSLVPMFHVAIVEAGQIMPDMVDLFARSSQAGERGNVVLITGPSKTADIEMNVVTGVHGPNVVHVFLLE